MCFGKMWIKDLSLVRMPFLFGFPESGKHLASLFSKWITLLSILPPLKIKLVMIKHHMLCVDQIIPYEKSVIHNQNKIYTDCFL